MIGLSAKQPDPTITVYVEALGLFGYLDATTGRFMALNWVFFQSTNCSGQAYIQFAPGAVTSGMSFVQEAGGRLWTLAGVTHGNLSLGSGLSTPATCQQGAAGPFPTTIDVAPAREPIDARYPYATPVRLVYE